MVSRYPSKNRCFKYSGRYRYEFLRQFRHISDIRYSLESRRLRVYILPTVDSAGDGEEKKKLLFFELRI